MPGEDKLSDKLKNDPEIIDLDQTGALPPEEVLPKEVTMDTQLLTDVSAEISLSMEDTQPLADIKALAEAIEKAQTSVDVPDGETRVITPPDTEAMEDAVPEDTMVILDLDKTSDLKDLFDDIVPGDDALLIPPELPETALDENGEYDGGDGSGEEYYEEDPGADYEEEDYEGDPENTEDYEGDPYAGDLDEEIDKATGLYMVPDEDDEEGGDGDDTQELPDTDAYPDTEEDGEDSTDSEEEEEDPRLFETGEIMSLEENRGSGEDDGAPAPVIKKTPANMIALAAAVFCFVVLCVIIGVSSYKNRSVAENKPYMYDVGERLARIGVTGQSGLMAMANAGHGIPVPEDDGNGSGEGSDENAVIPVKLNFTSVAKDIKLKFINTETDRLIMDVPFEVVLTHENGEQLRLKDEDMDGIIYKKDVTGGNYKLAVLDQEGYDYVSVPTSVTVKENISYQKIDVKEEIKNEAEVNAAVEDTGNGKEPEEGPPPTPTPVTGDTVEWVESTKTAKEGSDGYKSIEKADIPEPAYEEASVSRAGNPAAACVPAAPGGYTICGSEDPTGTPTPIPIKPDETPTPTPDDEPTPTPDPDETPTPKPTGDDPSGSPTPTDKDGKKDPKKDKTTKLKDKNGNQLYIKNGDKYEEAVYADYYKAEAFYVLGEVEYIYTGWQTLDGKTYFFDKNGNKVTGDQIIKGVKYHFDENGVLEGTGNTPTPGGNTGGKGILGIDVSKWNGSIDWNAVKASGVNFVIIRCGYRGSSTGVLVEDPTFRTNIQGAQAAGLKVGLYFFTQAVNEVEAVEEASMCLSLAQGYSISYPIFIDVEFTVNKNGRADGLDRATRSAVARAFCETINNGGYAGGVYSSKSWYGYSLDMSVIGGYKIWLAHYTSQTDYSGHYDIWQYSSKGSISGIKGNVDMNYSYMGY